MKKLRNLKCYSVLAIVMVATFCLVGNVVAGTSCQTKYPVILAHGMGASASILGITDYWYKIKPALEAEGAKVFITSVNGMDSTAAKAASFKNQVLNIKALTGAAKFNIIGHSHGTLYSRYAISNLGLDTIVQSHTSLCGPHRGSAVADALVNGLPSSLYSGIASSLDFFYAFVMGDKNPNSKQNGIELTRAYMANTFNPNVPNKAGITYQSWASQNNTGAPSLVLGPTWVYLLATEGANDGLVAVNSAKWGTFRGIVKPDTLLEIGGVDHFNMVGHLFGVTPGYNAQNFFKGIVSELKTKGC